MIIVLKNEKLHRIDGLTGEKLQLEEISVTRGGYLGNGENIIDWDGTERYSETPFLPVLQELLESLTNGYGDPEAYGSALAVGIAMLHQLANRWNEINGENDENA